MLDDLVHAVRRYADAHADGEGVARAPLPGLVLVRAVAPSELQYAINRPLVALVLQGGKHVTMGRQAFSFGAGDSLLIAADVPTVSRITHASAAAPYLSLVLELDLALIAGLAVDMQGLPHAEAAVQVEPTDADVAHAALRLMRLFERPDAVPVLGAQLLRELHYWLLAGQHGTLIRQLGRPDGQARRIARAVAILREEFASPLPVERLAAAAGMSASAFHRHFRSVTTLSPLQFQKQLRLIAARRMMLAEGAAASVAAHAVGYASVPQFTREYGRMFGQPPARDTADARGRARG